MLQFHQQLLLLNVQQLARSLSVSTRTVWRLDASGKIPAPVRVGSQKRWRREEIAAWLEAGCPARDRWHWPAVPVGQGSAPATGKSRA